ncbi:MAG: 4Fe-4S dicluster domain-containing protein [Candidatus Omnitrophota bacterium]
MKYISNTNLIKLLEVLKEDYDVYVPVKKGEQRFYKKYEDNCRNLAIGEVRVFEPLKAFFLHSRQKVAVGFNPEVPGTSAKPPAIFGVKACDLKGFKVQDHVFKNHDFEDPFYVKARNENLIISADCTCAIETCFCLALGIKPYPQEDFDINLSQIKGGYLVKVHSDKGKKIFEANENLFKDADQVQTSARDEQRQRVSAEVQDNIKKNEIPDEDSLGGAVEKNFESKIWEDEAKTCVECAACNTICPTCHCFLLYDQKDDDQMARLRIWDSCMLKDFAAVAGGANPRPRLWMRLRNRFEKKFDYFPKVAKVFACTGCGRCISACPAKIDIRRVLKRLAGKK